MIRIVKMTFQENKISDFLATFDANKDAIRAFKGVQHLSLLQDKKNTNIYFTYSIWESEEDLENYRNSALFQGIWKNTKPLFKEKAEAWSVDELVHL